MYVHYLYILNKVRKQQYPPRMTGKLKQDVMRFETLREQFRFLRENGIESEAQLEDFQKSLEDKLQLLTKQRTILNVPPVGFSQSLRQSYRTNNRSPRRAALGQPQRKKDTMNPIYKSYDELPLMLFVSQLAAALGISRAGAYTLVKHGWIFRP